MSTKYRLNPGLEIVRVSDIQVNISSPQGSYSLRDDAGLIAEVILAASKELIVDDFMIEVSDRFLAPAIEATIENLTKHKILVAPESVSDVDTVILQNKNRPQIFDPQGLGLAERSDPSSWRILLMGGGAVSDALKEAITRFGAQAIEVPNQMIPEVTRTTMVVGIADNEGIARFRELNRRAIATSVPALYVWLDRNIVRCGPLVLPHATACFECYFHRVRSSRRFVPEFDARTSGDGFIASLKPSQLSLQWAAAVALSHVVGHLSGTVKDSHLSPIREIDTIGSEIRTSSLLRLPRCPVCGSANSHRRPLPETFQHALVRRVN